MMANALVALSQIALAYPRNPNRRPSERGGGVEVRRLFQSAKTEFSTRPGIAGALDYDGGVAMQDMA